LVRDSSIHYNLIAIVVILFETTVFTVQGANSRDCSGIGPRDN